MARILVVDDDPLFLAIMSRTLENSRHEVVAVSSGGKAIELLQKEAFDALVCDLVLPNPSGLQVIREARHRSAEMPIIAISGGKAQGKTVHVDVFNMARAVGATSVVKKPFELYDFVTTVEAALEAQKASAVGG